MCVLVPQDRQAALLREVRRVRVRSSLLLYIPVVAIFSALALGYVFLREHAIVAMLRALTSEFISDERLHLVLSASVVVVVGLISAVVLRQICRECRIEVHQYCEPCRAVDSDDKGNCPICGEALSESAGFFSTAYSDEQALLLRHGLRTYAEA